MKRGGVEPRWLMVGGVTLLAAGYAALAEGPRPLARFGLLAFYGGLALLVTGVAIWLRRAPEADPADDDFDTDD